MAKKQGYWVVLAKHKSRPNCDSNQVIEMGCYKENRKTGLWKEFFCNNNLKNTITFENGRPNGAAIMYYENGQISEYGMWKNNRWIGEHNLNYENGKIQTRFFYNQKGKRDGAQFYFNKSGNIYIIDYFIDGKIDSGKVYFETRKIASITYYKNDKIDSCKAYFENGDIKTIAYKDSIKIIYNKNGKIVSTFGCKKVECYCEDKANNLLPKNYSEILYNDKREPVGKILYKDGKKVIEMNDEYYQKKLRALYFIDDTTQFNDSLLKKIKH